MIHHFDLIKTFIEESGWKIKDQFIIGDSIVMLWLERSSINPIWSLNFILQNERVRVLNRYKPVGYIEAEVDLYDPESIDKLEKVLQ